jgi:hypothetical protein
MWRANVVGSERVQVVMSWKDEAGPHRESFTVQLP